MVIHVPGREGTDVRVSQFQGFGSELGEFIAKILLVQHCSFRGCRRPRIGGGGDGGLCGFGQPTRDFRPSAMTVGSVSPPKVTTRTCFGFRASTAL